MDSELEFSLIELGFRNAWCLDFEFIANNGEKPKPICMVAKCVITGKRLDLWGDELSSCPFEIADDVLFIAYYASAESSCFHALGWPLPRRCIDLYAEFRCELNGLIPIHGWGLVGALLHYGLPTIGSEEKESMRALITSGGPWSESERIGIIAYCESDVDALLRLLKPMLNLITSSRLRVGHALLRGRYMIAAGVVENNGIPIDTELSRRIWNRWADIKKGLIEAIDADFNVYQDGRFVHQKFADYLEHHNIPWPRLATGKLALDDNTFRQQTKAYPKIAPLWELRQALGSLRLNDISIGIDGRNRTLLSCFRARTSRNQPSNTRFIFGPSVWIRYLIKPSRGRSLAYIDWSSQEIAIAAALSGDSSLWDAYSSGDPYLTFAKQAGLAPSEATKVSHPEIRQACKSIVLGVQYGMGADTIAAQSSIHVVDARELLQRHRETYRIFWAWAEKNINRALMGLPLKTVFGWRISYPPGCHLDINSRSILNWPMQSHGAEMMRISLSAAIESGLMICAPIHDAFLLEATDDEIDDHAGRLARIMGEASTLVLGAGKLCRSEIKIIRYPERFEDESRGGTMFARVIDLVEKAETKLNPTALI